MNISSILAIALGVSMDAFVVSITGGAVLKEKIRFGSMLKVGVVLAVFQALMPVVGWGLGSQFHFYIKNIDHWIAFFMLGAIGAKMMYDSLTDIQEHQAVNLLKTKVLLYLAMATSIDALAVGISFAMLEVSIWFSVICIGVFTFVLSIIGMCIGKVSGERLKKKAGVFGGVVLMLMGLEILLEHLGVF